MTVGVVVQTVVGLGSHWGRGLGAAVVVIVVDAVYSWDVTHWKERMENNVIFVNNIHKFFYLFLSKRDGLKCSFIVILQGSFVL